MCAITRTGMWRVYASATSQPPAGNASISALHTARVRGSSGATASAVKYGSTAFFHGLWSGGSEVIGGAGSGSTRTSRTMIRREEKCLVSCATARTPSYVLGK